MSFHLSFLMSSNLLDMLESKRFVLITSIYCIWLALCIKYFNICVIRLGTTWDDSWAIHDTVFAGLNQHLKPSLKVLLGSSKVFFARVFVYPARLSHRWSVCLAGYGIVFGSFCLYCVGAAVSQKWWGHILGPVAFYGRCWLWHVRVCVCVCVQPVVSRILKLEPDWHVGSCFICSEPHNATPALKTAPNQVTTPSK